MKFDFENFYILREPFGEYQTNCYILYSNDSSIIIDPGINATSWVLENAKNPLAILNTHGHFDHIWSNYELQTKLNIPLICPKEDSFMLLSDCFSTGLTPSKPDVLIDDTNSGQTFSDFEISFLHFPGHTPGCSVIVANHKQNKEEKVMFSGDFIFYRSIGRSDFPYSNTQDMIDSLKRFLDIKEDMPIFPGHGEETSIKKEQINIPYWLTRLT